MDKKLLLLVLVLALVSHAFAQKANWQNLDLQKDSVFGISTEKAYAELLKGKKANPVIVAVIDAGIDTAHEDLKDVLWHNPKKNAPDRFGWNYIGSAKGNVIYDNTEMVRNLRQFKGEFEGKDSSSIIVDRLRAYRLYQKLNKDYQKQLGEAKYMVEAITNFNTALKRMLTKIGKNLPTLADFQAYQPTDSNEQVVKQNVIRELTNHPDFKEFLKYSLNDPLEHYKNQLDYQLNINYDPRAELVGDDYGNNKQSNYGNADISAGVPTHGTHVAGIIGANRNNELGIKGVANHVQLMSIRAVPDGDERDKDIANAIRYAADHGAKVINMSFGKPVDQNKKIVDEAVKYALTKDILFVQAAGNDNKDLDTEANFPNRNYEGGGQAGAWIVVGASGWKDNESLKASFSNYGKMAVDVFAPGVKINSSIPGSKYEELDGTSMASPVVAGLAGLIREYYPKLTASQVKDIILKSVVKVNHSVNLKVGETVKSVPLSDLCKTGGIVNAYNALALAGQL